MVTRRSRRASTRSAASAVEETQQEEQEEEQQQQRQSTLPTPARKRQKKVGGGGGGGNVFESESLSYTQEDAGDHMRILVATDNHLGYKEDDLVRKDDSFDAFEEVFQIAVDKDVDLVLLGGDIFHQNKPSKRTICKTIEILRKYCLNDKKKVEFEVLNKDEGVFSTKFGSETNSFEVGLPTFTIHGNHDDPAGVDQVSPLDILSSSNLLNYYGKSKIEGEGTGSVSIKPVLLGKGKTRVALYGLGWIKDERLANLFQVPGGVKWCQPEGDYFNIFSVHQNRTHHSPKMYIKESLFWHDLDLVIWGHEHESLCVPVQSEGGKKYLISQPGSTVQTALTQGEAKQKHCMLLEIQEKRWRTTQIPLKSVRPFIFDNLNLKEALADDEEEDDFNVNMDDKSKEIEKAIEERVEEVLDCLKNDRDALLKEKLPLIRLRVDYSGYTTINTQRFGQKFVGRVANPNDIIIFTKKSSEKTKAEGSSALNQSSGKGKFIPDAQEQVCIDEFIRDNLSADLEVLRVKELNAALHDFVEKDEVKAFHECIDKAVDRAASAKKSESSRSNTNGFSLIDSILDDLDGEGEAKRPGTKASELKDMDDDSDWNDILPQKKPSSSRKGKAAAKKKRSAFSDEEDDSDWNDNPPKKKPSGRKGKAAAKSRQPVFNDDDDDSDWNDAPATKSRRNGKAAKSGIVLTTVEDSPQPAKRAKSVRALPLSLTQNNKSAPKEKAAKNPRKGKQANFLDDSQDSFDLGSLPKRGKGKAAEGRKNEPAGTSIAISDSEDDDFDLSGKSQRITKGGNYFQRQRSQSQARSLPKSWGKAALK